MVSSYFKIVIPTVSLKGSANVFRGSSILLFEKGTNNIVFNTLLLDHDQTIIGAHKEASIDTVWSRKLRKKGDLFKYRQESFKYNDGNKSTFSGDINFLNEELLKFKFTIKGVVSFITGANATGGLTTPDADPVRMLTNDFLNKKYEGNLKEDFKEWKLFSIMSNLEGKHRNCDFPDDVTISYLNKIEERDFSELFNLDLKHIPYGETGYEDAYVSLEEAFASQNSEKFINKAKANVISIMQSNDIWKEEDKVQFIFECINRNDKRFLTKQLKLTWRKIIEENIRENEFTKDFVKGMSSFQRAHILENRTAADKLLNENATDDEKIDYIKDLIDGNNYVLLTEDIHTKWDSGRIWIDLEGNINNNDLPDNEFKILTNNGDNIFNIFPNADNEKRKHLLSEYGTHG